MAKTFANLSAGKLMPGPMGLGVKVVEGTLSLGPASEAVHHSDVKLNTIRALHIMQTTPGSFVTVDVVAAGSYDNYASLIAYNLDGTGGYLATRSAGTLNAHFVAFGA